MISTLSKNSFSKKVEEKVRFNRETYLDSIINTCTEFNIEPDDCKKYLTPNVVKKLEAESIRSNLVMSDSASLL